MEMPIKNVAVVGGTGYIGKHIVNGLVAAGLNVTVLTRNPSSESHVFPRGVSVLAYDATRESLVRCFTGQQAVVSAVNATAIGDQALMIEAAVEAKVSRFIPSEYGTDPREEVTCKIPAFKKKKEIYRLLVKYAIQQGIDYTVIATGPFLDDKHLGAFWGFDVATCTVKAWDESKADIKIATTVPSVLGLAIGRILGDRDTPSFAKQTITIHSATITMRSLLAAFEKATKSKWTLNHVDMDEELEKNLERLSAGDDDALIPVIRGFLFDPGTGSDFGSMKNDTQDASKLLKLPETDVEMLVQGYVDMKRG